MSKNPEISVAFILGLCPSCKEERPLLTYLGNCCSKRCEARATWAANAKAAEARKAEATREAAVAREAGRARARQTRLEAAKATERGEKQLQTVVVKTLEWARRRAS